MKPYRVWIALVVASWLGLFCQLLVIRWLSAEVRVLAYLKNLPLLAAFLGLGLGSALAGLYQGSGTGTRSPAVDGRGHAGRRHSEVGRQDPASPGTESPDLFPLFALLAFVLATVVTLARPLGLVHLPLPRMPDEWWAWTDTPYAWAEWRSAALQAAQFLAAVLGLSALTAATFVPLGHRIGRAIAGLPRLPAYAVNLAASLLGVGSFIAVSALEWPPAAWWAVAAAPAIGLLLLDARSAAPSPQVSTVADPVRHGLRSALLTLRPARLTSVALLGAIPLLVAAGATTVAGPVAPGGFTRWSPYYRLDLAPLTVDMQPLADTRRAASGDRGAAGSSAAPQVATEHGVGSGSLAPGTRHPEPVASHYFLRVNHDYHQKALDLSDGALAAARAAEELTLSEGGRGSGGADTLDQARQFYDLPYQFRPQPPGRVLVVGSGTGNDVAAALRAGAGQVDAVEIDPAILRLGRDLHPERPYASPRVSRINDDARAYFRRAAAACGRPRPLSPAHVAGTPCPAYDLIVFGLLDSHTALASLAALRLDSYVYTRESLQEAVRLLAPGGSVALSFAAKAGGLLPDQEAAPGTLAAIRAGDSPSAWLARRLYALLAEATGREPLALDLTYDYSTLFIAGPHTHYSSAAADPDLAGLVVHPDRLRPRADVSSTVRGSPVGLLATLAALGGASALASAPTTPASTAIDLPTDDWPFLYLQARGVPFLPYGVALLAFVGAGGLATLGLLRSRSRALPPRDDERAGQIRVWDWPLFWLGAGFMLVETRAIAELSLLFGSTWTVTSVAVSAILAVSLAATGVAALLLRWRSAHAARGVWLAPWWALLALALAASYLFPFGLLAGLDLGGKALLGGAAAGLPVLFAGVIFGSLFARSADPAAAYGANLLGALCGGALEYTALAAGNRSLALVAVGLYSLAALATWRQARQRALIEADER